MNRTVSTLIHIGLAGCQFLVPAFAHLTPTQEGAVAAFLASVQTILGISAFSYNPDGSKVQPQDKQN